MNATRADVEEARARYLRYLAKEQQAVRDFEAGRADWGMVRAARSERDTWRCAFEQIARDAGVDL